MITREDHGPIAVLRMQHGKANALDLELLAALEQQLLAATTDGCGAVVLTGTGAVFSAGVDLFRILEGEAEYRNQFLVRLDAGLMRLFAFPKPIVAAVNGHAIAGGAIMAAACDQVIVADVAAKIGVTELLVGVPFPAAALAIFGSRLAPAVHNRLVLTGQTVRAADAVSLGLADELVAPEQLLTRAVAVAMALAAIPPETFALTKRQLRRAVLAAIEQNSQAFDHEVAQLWNAPAIHAKIRAFLDRTVGQHRPTGKRA